MIIKMNWLGKLKKKLNIFIIKEFEIINLNMGNEY